MSLKECRDCKVSKPVSEFYARQKHSKTKGDYTYYFPYCKDCTKDRVRGWREENREEYLEKMKIANQKMYRSKEGKEYFRKHAQRQRDSGYYREWQEENKDKIKIYGEKRQNKIHEISNKEWLSCKEYFNNQCSYCGLSYEEHIRMYNQDLHRDHVEDDGANDLSNCIPSCKPCNSSKHTARLEDWYNRDNPNYIAERLNRINQWLNNDYKKLIETN